MNLDKKLIVVFGPTSSGKTDLSLRIAKFIWGRFHLESKFINADSRQFYKGMDIGTNKVDKEIRKQFRHHLMDNLSPEELFETNAYKGLAEGIISEIHKRGRLPILVGGTGTFIMSIVGDRYLISPKRKKKCSYKSILFIPIFKRKSLYKKIERNVEKMFTRGLYGEIKNLIVKYDSVPQQLSNTLGYREFLQYCEQNDKDLLSLSRVDSARICWKIRANTKQYAMHQIGWLKKMKEVNFVDDFDKMKEVIVDFLTRE